MLNEHATTWMGYKVELFDDKKKPIDYANTIYRLALEWDDERKMEDYIAEFLSDPASRDIPGLIIGSMGEANQEPLDPVIEALVAARELPKLRGLFLLDVVSEENEISWIQQAEMSPLLSAYPQIEQLRIRGGDGLKFGHVRHEKLKSLIIETGGLAESVIEDILASELPSLEHLELWLGSDSYGWDGNVETVRPFYKSCPFPKLKYLGLRNAEITDDIAVDLGAAPVLAQLEELDLSMGTLSDVGGNALLANSAIKSLKRLNLEHNYLSEPVRTRLLALPLNVRADKGESSGDGNDRYVAVSE